jgi:hypothetical protein
MKTKFRFFEFIQLNNGTSYSFFDVIRISHNYYYGTIKYVHSRKKWLFVPCDDTIFTALLLQEIIDFLIYLNKIQ